MLDCFKNEILFVDTFQLHRKAPFILPILDPVFLLQINRLYSVDGMNQDSLDMQNKLLD
jgi:hypothetical protein